MLQSIMKKVVIILTTFILISVSCTQTPRKQAEATNISPKDKTTKNNFSSKSDEVITYRGLTLGDAYFKFLNDHPEIGKHLSKELSSDDKTYTSNIDNENVEIIYHPILDEDGLFIKLSYSNRVTTVNFESGENDVRVHIIYSL